jgi:hypothetical protein
MPPAASLPASPCEVWVPSASDGPPGVFQATALLRRGEATTLLVLTAAIRVAMPRAAAAESVAALSLDQQEAVQLHNCDVSALLPLSADRQQATSFVNTRLRAHACGLDPSQV